MWLLPSSLWPWLCSYHKYFLQSINWLAWFSLSSFWFLHFQQFALHFIISHSSSSSSHQVNSILFLLLLLLLLIYWFIEFDISVSWWNGERFLNLIHVWFVGSWWNGGGSLSVSVCVGKGCWSLASVCVCVGSCWGGFRSWFAFWVLALVRVCVKVKKEWVGLIFFFSFVCLFLAHQFFNLDDFLSLVNIWINFSSPSPPPIFTEFSFAVALRVSSWPGSWIFGFVRSIGCLGLIFDFFSFSF